MQPQSKIPTFSAMIGGVEHKIRALLSPSSRRAETDTDRAAGRERALESNRSAEIDRMIALIAGRGIRDERVLAALRQVPRHAFVPFELQDEAYADRALAISGGQTISQPYIVALMTESLELTPESRVLEIGTGSAYQTAILCELAGCVVTIEVLPELAHEAHERLAQFECANVACRTGDGHAGAPDAAPFDAIIVTAAPELVPRALIDQLAAGGRMCIPVGAIPSEQRLLRLRKCPDGTIERTDLAPVRFVPMIGDPLVER
jgi:protein-L-isoaspartate(D-aspartate) O-methyltransferase